VTLVAEPDERQSSLNNRSSGRVNKRPNRIKSIPAGISFLFQLAVRCPFSRLRLPRGPKQPRTPFARVPDAT
jgi:hypothetical protein